MKAAWGEGYFPYLYQNHPDPNYDPVEDGKISWDGLWNSEFWWRRTPGGGGRVRRLPDARKRVAK